MKKWLRGALCTIGVFGATLGLSACSTDDADKEVDVRVQDGYVQWQFAGDENWTNITTLDELLEALGDDLKGEKGETGEQGIQGEKGEKGQSAYEIAVEHGFVGTEEEWLASLKSENDDKDEEVNEGTNSFASAVLNVELSSYNNESESSEFSISFDGDKVVPGQILSNAELNLCNTSPVATYMIVHYTLTATTKNAFDQDVDTSGLVAMDLQANAVGDGWSQEVVDGRDGKTKLNFLVYLGDNGLGNGVYPANNSSDVTTKVLSANCLQVPKSWGNEMQGVTIDLTFVAYVIQAEAIVNAYPNISNADVTVRKRAIVDMFLAEWPTIDTSVAPTE